MGFLNVLRGIVFGLVALFSLVVLAFTIFHQVITLPSTLDSLPLAAAVITIVVFLVTFVLELVIRSGVTSLVVIELPRVFFLWVLWLASGAYFYSLVRWPASLCSENSSLGSEFEAVCVGAIIIPALSIVNFILLFAYFTTLLTFSAMNNHWTSAITRTDLMKKKGAAGANAGYGKPSGNQFIYSQPPMPQQQQGYYVPSPQGQAPGYGVPPQQGSPMMQGPGHWVPGPPPQFQGGYPQQQFQAQSGFQSPVPQQGYGHQAPQPGSHPATHMSTPRSEGQAPPSLAPEPQGEKAAPSPSHSPPLAHGT